MSLIQQGLSLATKPQNSKWIAPLLLCAEAVLCGLIIWRVPYTEIDWSTYMIQVKLFLSGILDYSKLTGPTGPLVYPALHVYIYSGLYYLTSGGENILVAQIVFAGLYLATLALVFACYRRVGAPPWLLVPLVLSKRLHSIFLLRLFNDCWATFFLWVSIYLLQRRKWEVGTLVWGMGVAVKMTLLLAGPGIFMVLIQGAGTSDAFFAGTATALFQLVIAMPFMDREIGFDYFWRAFNFGRVFLYEWTVNWRFLDEDTFLSREFAIGLLVLHASLLIYFLHSRWIRPSSTNMWDFFYKYSHTMSEKIEMPISEKVSPVFVMDTVLASNIIGLLCARSLHYQFYAYLGWTTPYLLWRSGGGPVWVLLNWAVQEISWLIYPSTTLSASIVVFELAVQVLCALIAPPIDHISPPKPPASKEVEETKLRKD